MGRIPRLSDPRREGLGDFQIPSRGGRGGFGDFSEPLRLIPGGFGDFQIPPDVVRTGIGKCRIPLTPRRTAFGKSQIPLSAGGRAGELLRQRPRRRRRGSGAGRRRASAVGSLQSGHRGQIRRPDRRASKPAPRLAPGPIAPFRGPNVFVAKCAPCPAARLRLGRLFGVVAALCRDPRRTARPDTGSRPGPVKGTKP